MHENFDEAKSRENIRTFGQERIARMRKMCQERAVDARVQYMVCLKNAVDAVYKFVEEDFNTHSVAPMSVELYLYQASGASKIDCEFFVYLGRGRVYTKTHEVVATVSAGDIEEALVEMGWERLGYAGGIQLHLN